MLSARPSSARISFVFGLFLTLAGFGISVPQSLAASRIEELQSGISSRRADIEALEKEIAQYQADIAKTGKEIGSLQSAIKNLDLTQKKLDTDIKVTEKKIESTELNIERLEIEIGGKQETISGNQSALRESLRFKEHLDGITPVEVALSNKNFGDFWDTKASLERFDIRIQRGLSSLKIEKQNLEGKRDESEKERLNLSSLKSRLGDQQSIARNAQKEKQKLLSTTKNKEANYKKLLAEKVARRDAFEKELLQFESQLTIELDPSRLPMQGSGALAWPLDSVFITQPFGDTEFSRTHAGVYNGKGHNGIDLRASQGTPIRSAHSGTVIGAGDTDLTCPGASYGKWILVEHSNGLSTLYAHLSLIKTTEGQTVGRSEIIGYSGDTGYSTGPHLHFTVFASQGVTVGSLKSKVPGCGTYRIPRASLNSYLNPLLYLSQ